MQTKNRTKARLDFFLVSRNSLHMVTGVSIGRACALSNHRPIHLHLVPSPVQKGRGFWRFNNDLLKDKDFIVGCNKVIADTMETYSAKLNKIESPTLEQYTDAEFDINYTLLHNVIMMEARSYTMKFVAKKRKEQQEVKS